MSFISKSVVSAFRSLGYDLTKRQGTVDDSGVPIDISDPVFKELFQKCSAFTFTHPDAMFSLYSATEYVCKNNIPGDFVECGVWKGGSAMLMALTLLKEKQTHRKIYLYDTYEGMSEPTAKDIDFRGEQAGQQLAETEKGDEKNVWCYSPMEEVKQNLLSTGYPAENIVYVKGKVEDSIPGTIPMEIALLRLDTDWYESTLHELIHLYPLMQSKGVLILDDYGHWKGAKDAADEYFRKNKLSPLLHRVNYTVRTVVK